MKVIKAIERRKVMETLMKMKEGEFLKCGNESLIKWRMRLFRRFM